MVSCAKNNVLWDIYIYLLFFVVVINNLKSMRMFTTTRKRKYPIGCEKKKNKTVSRYAVIRGGIGILVRFVIDDRVRKAQGAVCGAWAMVFLRRPSYCTRCRHKTNIKH